MVFKKLEKYGRRALKGIGKIFESVGREIKDTFKSFGKFMGKTGILGQVAMTFALPGLGGFIANGLGGILDLGTDQGSMGNLFANMAGSSNKFLQSLGKGLTFGYKAVGDVIAPFKNLRDTVFTLGKTAINKVGNIFGVDHLIESGPNKFLGPDGAFAEVRSDWSNMYKSDRWDKLKETTSTREALEKLSKENPGDYDGWSVVDGKAINPKFKGYIERYGNIEREYSHHDLGTNKPVYEALEKDKPLFSSSLLEEKDKETSGVKREVVNFVDETKDVLIEKFQQQATRAITDLIDPPEEMPEPEKPFKPFQIYYDSKYRSPNASSMVPFTDYQGALWNMKNSSVFKSYNNEGFGGGNFKFAGEDFNLPIR